MFTYMLTACFYKGFQRASSTRLKKVIKIPALSRRIGNGWPRLCSKSSTYRRCADLRGLRVPGFGPHFLRTNKVPLNLQKRNECPQKRDHFEKEISCSNHRFLGDMLVFRGGKLWARWVLKKNCERIWKHLVHNSISCTIAMLDYGLFYQLHCQLWICSATAFGLIVVVTMTKFLICSILEHMNPETFIEDLSFTCSEETSIKTYRKHGGNSSHPFFIINLQKRSSNFEKWKNEGDENGSTATATRGITNFSMDRQVCHNPSGAGVVCLG